MSARGTRTRLNGRDPAMLVRASCLALAACGALASHQGKNAVPPPRAPARPVEAAHVPVVAVPPSQAAHLALEVLASPSPPAAVNSLPPPQAVSAAPASLPLATKPPRTADPITAPVEVSASPVDPQPEPELATQVANDPQAVALAPQASIAPLALVAISTAAPEAQAGVAADVFASAESEERQDPALTHAPQRPTTAVAAVTAASIDPPAERDKRAYVAQITDTVREAYVAQLTVEGSDSQMAVRADGQVLGKVAFQVTDGQVSVRIGQVLDLFQAKFDNAQFARLRASQAADQFVSLATIQRAGIPLRYDAPYDELVLGSTSG